MKKARVTLEDIAEQAGVSKASVSMILSGKDTNFSTDTVMRVKQIAMAFNYKNTALNKGSAPAQMRNIILIISPNMYNPYYTQTIQAIERSARASGYQTLSYNTYRSPDRETEAMSMAVNSEIAGIIFIYIPIISGDLVSFIDKKIPIVVMGDPDWSFDIDMINVNYYQAGIIMANHLIELGHRHVAFLSTTMQEGNLQKRKRLKGIQDTFAKLDEASSVTVRSMDILPEMELSQTKIELTVGKGLVEQCIEDRKITAFIGVNDMVAYGIIEGLLERGYRIPQDYSVCGYDDIFPSSFQGVSLTTIDLGMETKGELAFSMLCTKIANEKAHSAAGDTVARIEYKAKLVKRESSGKARELDSAKEPSHAST